MESTLINDNVVTFTSTEQLTACNGKNLCEVAILDEGYRIGTLNFWLEVELDPLKGGINSTSEIHDLYEQVEDITEEVIGDNYYNKTEVDELLDAKADASSVYTKTETDTKLALKANAADVYTKAQTDTMLSAKADASDVYTKAQVETKLADKADAADVYNKTEVDTALALKANAADVYTKSQVDTALAAKADAATVTAALATKADKSDTYTKEQVDTLLDNIFPTLTASGSIASFTTALAKPLVSITPDETATIVTACGVNLWDEEWELGYYNTSNGQPLPINDRIRTKNYIPIKPETVFRLVIPSSHYIMPLFYDKDKNYLGYIANGVYSGYQNPFTSLADACYLMFYVSPSYGTTYNNDISINYPSTDTAYHAYSGQTVPAADADTLATQYGVNNVYADAGNITAQYKYMSI